MSKEKENKSWGIFLLLLGIAIGIYVNDHIPSNKTLNGKNKMDEILSYIQENYVDTLNMEKTQDKAIEALLQQLDPHSTYIPASELQSVNEDLEGNFEGIGVEFRILNDTVVVLNVISDGPSEKAGLHDGDRIIKVDDKNIAGISIKNNDVMKLLKGEGGTKVKVTVFRKAVGKALSYDITRGKIPIYSITASYMVDKEIGYVLIDRFAATTHDEFIAAVDKLQDQGMKKLIIDVRNNPGGYLETAVDILDEMIDGEKMLVYTEGKNRKRQSYKSSKRGILENTPIAVLINESSASAAEILAGALQDWDRADIIGRRSFGKGLVQEQTNINDGSAIRLTVARYYIPSGRCIQKSYSDGTEKYSEDLLDRENHGELFSKDSIKVDSSKTYKTAKGKEVYGGGGIIPDYFIPLDTSNTSSYLSHLYAMNCFSDFSYGYAEDNLGKLKKYSSASDFAMNYKVDDKLLSDFTQYASQHGVPYDAYGFNRSKEEIKKQLKTFVARIAWDDEGLYRCANQNDPTYNKAIEMLK